MEGHSILIFIPQTSGGWRLTSHDRLKIAELYRSGGPGL
jgi:hypothetical protein